jgi:3-deoxy-D-manno-octulosonate 8-phosphate phosphatase (KDO 8-P phosphatase)
MAKSIQEIKSVYESIGGQFITDIDVFAEKVKALKGLLFDWDGVFNAGIKGAQITSPFSEPDSMGLNMLRYGFYKQDGAVPLIAIITGEKNNNAFVLAERENFQGVFYSLSKKVEAIDYITKTFRVEQESLLYMFDDIADFGVAGIVGLRIFIPRKANPLLTEYVINNNLADYVTGCTSGENPIREVTELLHNVLGNFEDVIADRIAYVNQYAAYVQTKKLVTPGHFTSDNDFTRPEGSQFTLIQ